MNTIEARPFTLLHIDSSARLGISGRDRHGSHSRRLSERFVTHWLTRRPDDCVIRRDVAAHPPAPVDAAWIDAAFTPEKSRSPEQRARLAESDMLVEELLAADLLVIGVPMYNFGVPSPLKAWIDNVVRMGRTFGFDRARKGDPYWPMVPPTKRVVILTARGDYGYAPGERLAAMDVVAPGLKVPLRYIGITHSHTVAVEYDEFGDDRLAASLAAAERAVDGLVEALRHGMTSEAAPG